VSYIQALTGYKWELFIIPNNIEKSEWPEDERIIVMESGRVGPADKRDLSAQKASGNILVFLDDDSYPEPDILEVANEYFKDSSVIAVGGPGITPKSNGFWQRVSGAVFLSTFTGGAPERYVPVGKSREMDDWPSVNLMVRKDIFLSVGGFDCRYWPGEDTRLCLKLKETGKKLIYAPDMIVYHHRRSGLKQHLKQVGAYGYHRGFFAKKYPKTSFRIKYFIPSSFALLVFTTVFIYWVPNLFIYLIPAWIAYIFIITIGIIETLKFENFFVALPLFLYVPLTHFYYGIQFFRGFIKQDNLVSRLR
jgi:GT2 family glycosyltransferase